MGQKFGSQHSQAMWVVETAWGTPVVTTDYFGILKGYNFTFKDAKIDNYGLGERGAQSHSFGPFSVEGSVDYFLTGVNGTENSKLFEIILGSKTAAGTGAIDHQYTYPNSAVTYQAGISTLKSATIELAKNGTSTDDISWIIPGCVCKEAKISIKKDSLIEVSTSWMAKTVTQAVAVPATFAPSATQIPFNAATTMFRYSGSASTNSANTDSVGIVDSATITIGNELIDARGLGDRLAQAILSGQQKITWSCTLVLDTALLSTMYAKAFGTAGSPLTVDAGVDSGTSLTLTCTDKATASSPAYKIGYDFILSNAVITDHSEAIDVGNNLCMVTFNGRAKSIQVLHFNGVITP